MQRMELPPAQAHSWEHILHQGSRANQLLRMDDLRQVAAAALPRGHRAIGVVYHPWREAGNYVPTNLPGRYDAFLYFDETQALHPLHIEPKTNQAPDTYPWGV